VLNISVSSVALVLLVPMLASIVGLLWLDRRLKRGPVQATKTLFWLALLALTGVVALLIAHTLWVIVPALLVISLSWTCWYPLAKAEAYACKPGHTGVVRAVLDLGGPFRVALPGMIGLISGTFGLFTGVSVLCIAPVLLLLLLPYRKVS
jgi:fucose permease